MKTFFLTVLLGAAAVFAFDAAVDPASRWHGKNYAVKADWSPDEVWITPFGYDERSYMVARLTAAPRPDVLLLGSSKVMLADTGMFPKGRTVLNAGMAGASVEDYVAIWQLLKEQDKTPKRVVIFADAWVFNRNNEQPRWQTNIDLFYRFLSGRTMTPREAWFALWHRKYQLLTGEIADLFTWKIFSAEVALHRDRLDASFVKLADRPEDRGARRFDGSLVYPKDVIRPRTLAEIRDKAREFLAGDIYSMTKWAFDQKASAEMKALLADMLASGADVVVVTPPYQTYVTKSLRERPGYKEIFASVDDLLRGFQKDLDPKRLKLCDAMDATAAGCSETDFFDAMHSRRECTEKILRWCGAAGS